MTNLPKPEAIELALIKGDLAGLTSEQRISYYNGVCESLGLNPMTKPFEFVAFQGKLVLYANKNAAEQLRAIHKISINIASKEKIGDLYIITARATNGEGRVDEATAALDLAGLAGLSLANAIMKCETKAKRRVTLSICGLGMLDESEIESISDAEIIKPDEPRVEPPKALTMKLKTADEIVGGKEGYSFKYDAAAITLIPKQERDFLRSALRKHKYSSKDGVIYTEFEIPELSAFRIEEDDLPEQWEESQKDYAEAC